MNKILSLLVHYFISLYYSYVDQSGPQSVQNLTVFKVGFQIQFWKLDHTHTNNVNKQVQATYQGSLVPKFELCIEQRAENPNINQVWGKVVRREATLSDIQRKEKLAKMVTLSFSNIFMGKISVPLVPAPMENGQSVHEHQGARSPSLATIDNTVPLFHVKSDFLCRGKMTQCNAKIILPQIAKM